MHDPFAVQDRRDAIADTLAYAYEDSVADDQAMVVVAALMVAGAFAMLAGVGWAAWRVARWAR